MIELKNVCIELILPPWHIDRQYHLNIHPSFPGQCCLDHQRVIQVMASIKLWMCYHCNNQGVDIRYRLEKVIRLIEAF